MELVLTHVNIEPLPKQEPEPFIFKNEGLLTSNYKEEIQDNFFNSKPNSVFGIKQKIKSSQYQYSPSVDAILKLSVFAIAIAAIIL
jgi:outer membrane receptor for Fe3+-dicitrate